jgi:hypothetical protein
MSASCRLFIERPVGGTRRRIAELGETRRIGSPSIAGSMRADISATTPTKPEDIEMTDVRRTGPPRRLEDRTRFGIPIEGEVDGIWQRAFHFHLAEEVRRQPDLPGGEFFEKSLTINPAEIKFRFVGSASLLPNYLNLIASAIPPANRTAAEDRQRVDAAVAEAEREVRERDQDIERELKDWADRQPAEG